VGLEAARREIDDQLSDLALPTIFETRSQKLDVRRKQEAGLRIEVVEGALDEGEFDTVRDAPRTVVSWLTILPVVIAARLERFVSKPSALHRFPGSRN